MVVEGNDVGLGEFQDFTGEDWLAHKDQECIVSALYNDRIYKACVLQVNFVVGKRQKIVYFCDLSKVNCCLLTNNSVRLCPLGDKCSVSIGMLGYPSMRLEHPRVLQITILISIKTMILEFYLDRVPKNIGIFEVISILSIILRKNQGIMGLY